MVGAEAGPCVACAVEHEVPYGVDPTPTRRVSHDEVGAYQVRLLRPAVEVAEELAHHGLLPDHMMTRISHHAPEPRAAAAPRAEDPDDVFGPYAVNRLAIEPTAQRGCPQGDLPVLAGQPAAAPAQQAGKALFHPPKLIPHRHPTSRRPSRNRAGSRAPRPPLCRPACRARRTGSSN